MSQAPRPTIAENLAAVHGRMTAAAKRAGRHPQDVMLLAVTKGIEVHTIRAAYDAGQRHFGENRVQEAQAKLPALADLSSATWHMIGSLQTNKVKACLDSFDIIHSVDSAHLAKAISARAQLRIAVFLEVNVAAEDAKHGFLPSEVATAYGKLRELPVLNIVGLMTVAPQRPNAEAARPVFRRLREIATGLGLGELSMGMSGDFEVAIEEGSTMVRAGTAIFGQRGLGVEIR